MSSEISLSNRGEEMKKMPLFFSAMLESLLNVYHPEENSNGIINLNVAENVLMADEMCAKIRETQNKFPIQPNNLNYTDFTGDPLFRKELALLLQKFIFKTEKTVDPNDIVTCNGAGTVLEQLGASLCDAGEYVMIPAPMYHAFPNDFSKRFNALVLPVHLGYDSSENSFRLNLDVVEKTYENAIKEGKKVRALLICSPNNPTGEIYGEDVFVKLMNWCEKQKIHFISDEVYALSILQENHVDEFISAGKLMLERYNRCTFTHIIYSFSKDFILNGFRIGVLYTHHKGLMEAMRSCSYFTAVSSHTQQMMTHILQDHEFVESFVKSNAQKMYDSYETVRKILEKNNIKYIKPKGGVFIFLNLQHHIQKWLKKSNDYQVTTQDEAAFWKYLLKHAKVNISPGNFFLCTQAPGWFRICFTATKAETLQLAFDRIFSAIDKRMRTDDVLSS
jgi:aspartate/methionine/tyrosine aminotransferase